MSRIDPIGDKYEAPNRYEAPTRVKASEMRRHWWVSFVWLNTTTQADPEPIYMRGGIRPIEESVEAAAQFDEFIKNYQANKEGTGVV